MNVILLYKVSLTKKYSYYILQTAVTLTATYQKHRTHC